jgi:hypothetical protein
VFCSRHSVCLRSREITSGVIRYLVPFSWVDTPGTAAAYTYTISIFANTTNATAVSAETCAMKLQVATP